MQTLPFEGHNVAYQCQSNIACEYEVNLSTNEKVITEKQTLTQIVKEQCWWKGLDLSNIVCEYEVNPLTKDKVITEIQNFNAKW